MVLVDSSIWIEATRRGGDLGVKLGLKGLLDEDEAVLCSPVWLEVYGGAYKDERRKLGFYLNCVPFRDVRPEDWRNACGNTWKLRDRGVTVAMTDTLIATIALRLGYRVYARDKHFDAMAPILGLTVYKPGYGGKFAPDGG